MDSQPGDVESDRQLVFSLLRLEGFRPQMDGVLVPVLWCRRLEVREVPAAAGK